MSASFRKINYSLRPAKYAERRMMTDVIRRLWPFQKVDEYTYVGFGSVWFSDFILFHRALGIRKMISIEERIGSKQRIVANKPFRIQMHFKPSAAALPLLRWSERQVIWLDYDDGITQPMLDDVALCARKGSSGTLIAVTVKCHMAPDVAAEDQNRDGTGRTALERFRLRFARGRVAEDVEDADLYGWAFGSLSRQMILNELNSRLAERNSKQGCVPMNAELVCELEYDDNAKMTTVIFVLHSDLEADLVEKCGFPSLDFLSGGSKRVRITVPNLTIREFRQLEKQLPLQGHELQLGSIPPGEAATFSAMYRYLPNFAVLES